MYFPRRFFFCRWGELTFVVLLGRRLFLVVFGGTTKMHDIYAYGLGLYTFIGTILFTEFAVEQLAQLHTANNSSTLKRNLLIGTVRAAKWAYLIVFGCVLLPLLVGMCLDLYLMLPFRRWFSPESKVEMQILQNWAFGVIHLKIAGRIILYLDGQYAQHLRNVMHNLYTSVFYWFWPNVFLDVPTTLDEPKYPSCNPQIPHTHLQTRSFRTAYPFTLGLRRPSRQNPVLWSPGCPTRKTNVALFERVSSFPGRGVFVLQYGHG